MREHNQLRDIDYALCYKSLDNDSLLEELDGSYEEIADRLKQFMNGNFEKDIYHVQPTGFSMALCPTLGCDFIWGGNWEVRNKKTDASLSFNQGTIHLAEKHNFLKKDNDGCAINLWEFYHEFMPTVELRVHHLNELGRYLKFGQRKFGLLEFLYKEIKLSGLYTYEWVTEKDLRNFALSTKEHYEKVLEGKYRIKLVFTADAICDGGCTMRKEGECDPYSLPPAAFDFRRAKPDKYDVKLGRSYSLQQILYIIERYLP